MPLWAYIAKGPAPKGHRAKLCFLPKGDVAHTAPLGAGGLPLWGPLGIYWGLRYCLLAKPITTTKQDGKYALSLSPEGPEGGSGTRIPRKAGEIGFADPGSGGPLLLARLNFVF